MPQHQNLLQNTDFVPLELSGRPTAYADAGPADPFTLDETEALVNDYYRKEVAAVRDAPDARQRELALRKATGVVDDVMAELADETHGAATSEDLLTRISDPDWAEQASQKLAPQEQLAVRALRFYLRRSSMLRNPAGPDSAAPSAHESASRNVDAAHESVELQRTILRDYAAGASIHIGEKRGFGTLNGESFQPDQPAANIFWGRMHLDTAYSGARSVLEAPVEAVAFTPATETVYRTETVTPARPAGFMRKAQPAVTRQVEAGQRQLTIRNVETGEDEPAVHVDYAFDGNGFHQLDDMPKYTETGGTRGGNMLSVRLQLPQSVADRLHAQVLKDPSELRALSDELIVQAYADEPSRMDKDTWFNYEDIPAEDGGTTRRGRGRPPYEQLPEGWTLSVLTPKADIMAAGDFDPRYPHADQMDLQRVSAPAQR